MNSANGIKPHFDLDKIKFATDQATFKRAIGLYDSRKVTEFKEDANGFSATVLGTKPYRVFVDIDKYDLGTCECYLGQNGTLCKHMVAVAIFAVLKGKLLQKQDKEISYSPICCGKQGELGQKDLIEIEKSLTQALKYIKPYTGPSRIWFTYQDSLFEGCNRMSAIISKLPVCISTSNLIVKLLLRLDKKLTSGGIDDSNGTVGDFIAETVNVLIEFAKLNPSCIETFKALQNRETCFGWEEPLLKIYEKMSKSN